MSLIIVYLLCNITALVLIIKVSCEGVKKKKKLKWIQMKRNSVHVSLDLFLEWHFTSHFLFSNFCAAWV